MKLVSYEDIAGWLGDIKDVSEKRLSRPNGLAIFLAETSLDVAPVSVIFS
jgi:hypothetical protein